jgi:hypothetical protein
VVPLRTLSQIIIMNETYPLPDNGPDFDRLSP